MPDETAGADVIAVVEEKPGDAPVLEGTTTEELGEMSCAVELLGAAMEDKEAWAVDERVGTTELKKMVVLPAVVVDTDGSCATDVVRRTETEDTTEIEEAATTDDDPWFIAEDVTGRDDGILVWEDEIGNWKLDDAGIDDNVTGPSEDCGGVTLEDGSGGTAEVVATEAVTAVLARKALLVSRIRDEG